MMKGYNPCLSFHQHEKKDLFILSIVSDMRLSNTNFDETSSSINAELPFTYELSENLDKVKLTLFDWEETTPLKLLVRLRKSIDDEIKRIEKTYDE